jgi:hypothetical protein
VITNSSEKRKLLPTYSILRTEAVFSPETLVITYQTSVNREKSVMTTCILEMAGSNVVRDIDYAVVIGRFTQSSMQMSGHDLKTDSGSFLPDPQFFIY